LCGHEGVGALLGVQRGLYVEDDVVPEKVDWFAPSEANAWNTPG
jgi:hypothetical protein